MDWLSHYMIAFLLGRKMKLDNLKMQALTLSALILDMDVVKYLAPTSSLPTHGTLSHTLWGAIIFTIAATVVHLVWKRKFTGHWVALGITIHLVMDMINTISPYDGGKQLFYPFSEKVYSLEPYFNHSVLAWAIIAATVFAFSFVMFIRYARLGDAPWRVWWDERPFLERQRAKKMAASSEKES